MNVIKVLITGGAGSIGSALAYKLAEQPQYNEILALDNNEYGLHLIEYTNPKIKVVLGDVRDKQRLLELLHDVDVVIHTAALKRVDMAEYNVSECIKTNITGTVNLAEACHERNIKKLLLISSDKAVATGEMALYGVTKNLQEKIILSTKTPPICAVSRFGNVIETRGNVCEIWKKQHNEGKPLTITNAKMRRYFWSMSEATDFISKCLELMQGKEIFIPDIKEYNVLDFARQYISKDIQYVETGLREGEVFLHELISKEERMNAERTSWGWIIRNKTVI